jgi:presenilin 1
MKSSASAGISSSTAGTAPADKYGALADGVVPPNEDASPAPLATGDYVLQNDTEHDGLMRFNENDSDDDSEDSEEYEMSMGELLYSTSSYYAIAKPVTLAMVLSALAVVNVNNDYTRAQGQQAMASAYEVFDVNSGGSGQAFALSMANALIMVSFICALTFVIVLLYHLRFMKCLIGYMIISSGTLLGVLGGNMMQVAVAIYEIPVDKLTFYGFIYNFCIVGVLAIFFGRGIPKSVTQGYLIATSVILAWHLSYFDDWTTWTLLMMLALYDLCAVLTPCGPLKALVNLMSQDDSPDMPGLLFEAELPPEAKRPGGKKSRPDNSAETNSQVTSHQEGSGLVKSTEQQDQVLDSHTKPAQVTRSSETQERVVQVPLAIAKVYNLSVIGIPLESISTMHPKRSTSATAAPLLSSSEEDAFIALPTNPSTAQLRASVTVRLPTNGGRLEPVARRGKKVYLERDRHGEPKRVLWVDRDGKVFAELRDGDEEAGNDGHNSIRLGLGDFIFYSVLVAKAAQYSFATFAACLLVILAGLGGTLVLLSVYHSALPALPISIFLGVIFYILTRWSVEPWIEAILTRPYYV